MSIFFKKVVFWLISLVIIIYPLYQARSILSPFIVAIIVAYFLNPLVNKLKLYSLSRTSSSLLIIFSFFSSIILIIIIVFPFISKQALIFVNKFPIYNQRLINETLPKIIDKLTQIDEDFLNRIKNIFENVASSMGRYAFNFINNLWQSGLSFINILSLIFITPLITFYLLRDWELIIDVIKRYLPIAHQSEIFEQCDLIDQALSIYIRAQINVCLIMGAYYALALSIVEHELGLIIGLLCGLLMIIPYIGIVIGFGLSIITGIMQFASYNQFVLIIIIFAVGQIIEGNFITPRLIGDKIGIHPAWMIFSLLIGGNLFGFYGLLFAVPVCAIVKILLNFGLSKYLNSPIYKI